VKSIIVILLIVLCAPEFLIAENLSSEQDPLLDWKRFKNYELFAFDTEKNNYSDKIDIHRLPKLQELWKQAKTNYVNQPIGCKEAHEATKASFILADTKFLSKHIVFLMNATRVVCMHNQFMSNNPCVIGIDGQYFGWPGDTEFNEIMERENKNLSLLDIPILVDFYLNITTGAYLITESNSANFSTIIGTSYEIYSNFNHDVLKHISPPKTKQIDDLYEIIFFTYSHYTTQSPSGLNKWTILFGKNGEIKNKTIEMVFEFEYPDKIKYGESFKLD